MLFSSMPLKIHNDSTAVLSLAALSDNRLASGSLGGCIKIWNTTKPDINPFPLIKSPVWSLAVLSDERLAAGDNNGTIWIWNFKLNEIIQLKKEGSPVHALAILPDTAQYWDSEHEKFTKFESERLVSGSLDGTIQVWDPSSKTSPISCVSRQGSVQALTQLSHNQITAGCHKGTVTWLIGSKEAPRSIEIRKNPLHALIPLSDKQVATGHENGTINIFDSEMRKVACLEPDRGQKPFDPVKALVLLADSQYLAAGYAKAGGETGAIRIWNWQISPPTLIQTLEHKTSVYALSILTNRSLAAGGEDGFIYIYPLNTPTTPDGADSSTGGAASSTDKPMSASGAPDHR